MGIVNSCFEEIVCKTTKWVIKVAKREVGYMIYYKDNVRALEDEMDELGVLCTFNKERVRTAMNNGEDILEPVTKWLKSVEEITKEVNLFLQDKNKDYQKCCKVSCPNLCSRCRLGREAKKKLAVVTQLIKQGKTFPIVSRRRPSLDMPTLDDYENFESREHVFEEILMALRKNDVAMVGIWGMPGVGKSTMVQKVREQVKKESLFHEVAMANVSQKLDVRDIQAQLAADLELDLFKAEHEKGRAVLLKNRLNNATNILVILDDVWDELQLKNIGIDFGDTAIKAGCKNLLSSRRRDVCRANKCPKPLLIELLNKNEAWDLFKKKAGSCVDIQDIHPIAMEVCEECGRLPLVIRAVGAALKDAEKPEWDDALRQLMNFAPEKIGEIDSQVYLSLELSYNQLKQEDAKSCFLLCSLFHGEISIDNLVRHAKAMGFLPDMEQLEEARDRVITQVKILKSCSLLLEGRDGNTVKMHNVIRDVAVSLASRKDKYAFLIPKIGVSRWPETDRVYKAISLSSANIHQLPDKLILPELHTIMLECRNHPIQVPDTFFIGLKELKVLNLSRMSTSSLFLSLPVLANLRMLCLTDCKSVDISILASLKKLEILCISGSDIRMLPPGLTQLTDLRLLDLRNCINLIVIPPQVISSMSSLEEVYFPDEFDKWKAEVTHKEIRSGDSILVELSSLTGLTTVEFHAPDVVYFNGELCERLTRFKISIGSRFRDGHRWSSKKTLGAHSDFFDEWSKTLKLARISLNEGGVKILMSKAEVLFLKTVSGLQQVFEEKDGGCFVNLKYLKMEYCMDVAHLAGQRKWVSSTNGGRIPLESFSNLRELDVLDCEFNYLFSLSIARGLVQLQRLVIKDCVSLKEIIRNENEGEVEENIVPVAFPQLKYVFLRCLPRLGSFYHRTRRASSTTGNTSIPAQPLFTTKVAMPGLEELEINGVENVTEISENECPNLKTLIISSCNGLRNAFSPSMARKLEHLRVLQIHSCEKLEGIITEMGNGRDEIHDKIVFPQLKTLILCGLQNLKNFWSCGSEVEMSHEVEPNITQSQFCCCCWEKKEKQYTRFPPLLLIEFPSLEKLELTRLVINSIEVCGDSFSILRILNMEECGKVSTVVSPHLLQRLQNLEELSVDRCVEVTKLFDLEGLSVGDGENVKLLPKLSRLYLRQLLKLNCLWSKNPNGILSFQSLTEVVIQNCGLLRNVFTCSVAGALDQLRILVITSCPMMEEIVSNEERAETEIRFPQLKFIRLVNLENLTSFCSAKNYAFNMPSLKVVILDRCPKMLTFTCGKIRTPKIKVKSAGSIQSFWVTDLNDYKGKGLAMVDNNEESDIEIPAYDHPGFDDEESDTEIRAYDYPGFDDDGERPYNQTYDDGASDMMASSSTLVASSSTLVA